MHSGQPCGFRPGARHNARQFWIRALSIANLWQPEEGTTDEKAFAISGIARVRANPYDVPSDRAQSSRRGGRIGRSVNSAQVTNRPRKSCSTSSSTSGRIALRRMGSEASMSADERRVVDAIDDEETLALLRELIRCPSENPPGREEATATCLVEYFERQGIPVRLEEILPRRPNVIAEFGRGGGPTLVFNGHTDTVPAGPGWTLDPFGADVRDGRVYGRGACDMLAGVAAMSAATVTLKRSGVPLSGRVLVHAVIDEEEHSLGSKAAAKDMDADWVIVTESTGGAVQAFGKGQLNVEITFTGKAAHSSRPDEGRNAIHDAAAFIGLIEREHRGLADDPYPGVGPLTFSTDVSTGRMTGSIVAPDCTIVLDRRLLPMETLEDAQAHVERLLEQLAAERPGLEFTLRPTLRFPPFPPRSDDRLARTVGAAVRDVGAGSGEISGARGATDAAWYAARGIPTVIYGPGDGKTAHQADEWIAVDDLRRGTRALALAAARLVMEERP